MIKLISISIFLSFTAVGSVSVSADTLPSNCSDWLKNRVVTQHSTQINGKTVSYTATAGLIEVMAADNQSKGCIFYTSYTVPHADGLRRPITFVFNGGPGGASMPLHLGFFGPKRVDLGPDGMGGDASGVLNVNEYSPLDVTDIVMIDPMDTGFSFAEPGSKDTAFFGANNDYISISNFVQNYINFYNRWDSPKFIAGESYGGMRGPLMASFLQSRYKINIAGLYLISGCLSTTTYNFGEWDNNVSYWTIFPSYAVAAWYHKTINPKYQSLDLESVYQIAEAFANTVLRDTLDRGNTLTPGEVEGVAQQMSEFTGLTAQQIISNNLKIGRDDFVMMLLQAQNKNIGDNDMRFDALKVGPTEDYHDPSSMTIYPKFVAAINGYLRNDLQVPYTSRYVDFYTDIPSWDFLNYGQGNWDFPHEFGVLDQLTSALIQNPNLNISMANGYYDFQCTISADEYDISQIPMDLNLAQRIQLRRYEGGHMIYNSPSAQRLMKKDFADFVTIQSAKN